MGPRIAHSGVDPSIRLTGLVVLFNTGRKIGRSVFSRQSQSCAPEARVAWALAEGMGFSARWKPLPAPGLGRNPGAQGTVKQANLRGVGLTRRSGPIPFASRRIP